jgi:hypothetical protein
VLLRRSSIDDSDLLQRLILRVTDWIGPGESGLAFVTELAPVRDPTSTVAAIATALDVQQRQHLSIEETLVE